MVDFPSTFLSTLLLGSLHFGEAARAMLVLSAVIALGMAIGSLKVKGLGLGAAAVLFAGLAFGHVGGIGSFSFHLDKEIIEFARDFGLALFVYAVGMQVGPSFFGSLRKQGLGLNLLATGIVVLGSLLTVCLIFLNWTNLGQAVGIYTGAVTNTPAMAAAQQAIGQLADSTMPEQAAAAKSMLEFPAIGYAVAYPGGVMGIIGSLLLIRWLFRINLKEEAEAHERSMQEGAVAVERVTVRVENDQLAGKQLKDLSELIPDGVVISRMKRGDTIRVVDGNYVVAKGDRLLVVGDARRIRTVAACFGAIVDENLINQAGPLLIQRLVVTDNHAIGSKLSALLLLSRYGVTATRVNRGDREFPASPNLVLQAGDLVTVVGEQAGLAQAAGVLGNSVKALNHPHFIPLFLGLGLGIVLGSIALPIPGVPVPVKLGLAGGPLLVALITSSLLRVGPLVFYLPPNALVFMRELGISLFLACVGLKSGPDFWPSIQTGGAIWILYGIVITMVPLLAIGIIGRKFMKLNYLTLCGVMSGAMTDPPALAFAQNISRSEGASVSYSLVYPLTMFLRILSAQLIVIFLC